jgi:hypothetical protein
MDGLAYKNWGNSNNGEQSPPTYNSDSYGFSPEASPQKRGKSNSNMYDYNIENDDDNYDSSPEPISRRPGSYRENKLASSGTAFSDQPNRRKSTEERMKEILERNEAEKKTSKPTKNDDDIGIDTLKSSWDDLLAGISSPTASLQEDDSPDKPEYRGERGERGDNRKKGNAALLSPTDSSFGDLDISASDLEVGAIAARRNKEKVSEKLKQKSTDQASTLKNTTTTPDKPRAIQISESPNITHLHREPPMSNLGGPNPGFKMSTAISAIYKNSLDEEDDTQSSVEASRGETDMYNRLKNTNDKLYYDEKGEKGEIGEREDSTFQGSNSGISTVGNKSNSRGPQRGKGGRTDDSDDSQEETGNGEDGEDEEGEENEGEREEEGGDDGEYSLDDFDGEDYKEKNTKPSPNPNPIPITTTNQPKSASSDLWKKLGKVIADPDPKPIPNSKANANSNPTTNPNPNDEKLSPEEIERRKSFELIKLRWLASTADTEGDQDKEKEKEKVKEAEREKEREREREKEREREEEREREREERERDDESEREREREERDQSGKNQESYDMSMISRNADDKDSDRVLGLGAASRYGLGLGLGVRLECRG